MFAQLTGTADPLAEVTTAHAAELRQVRIDAARKREELRGRIGGLRQGLEGNGAT